MSRPPSPIPRIDLANFSVELLNPAVIIDLPKDVVGDPAIRFRQYAEFDRAFPYVMDRNELSIGEVSRFEPSFDAIASSLTKWGLSAEKVSEITRSDNKYQGPHVDNVALTPNTVVTFLVPIAHSCVFGIHNWRSTRVAEGTYGPGKVIAIAQKPMRTRHSALTQFDAADSAAGFEKRVLWAIDCRTRR